jgi:uncharacterized membrane-anchored protein YitT (DUF2179 family)
MNSGKKSVIRDYALITVCSFLYALALLAFIFPHALLLGGTGGISVILNTFLSSSPAIIMAIINILLVVLAFLLLGNEMATRTLVGSTLTAIFSALLDPLFSGKAPLIGTMALSVVIGAVIIAITSAIMFYIKSSSGGTDIIALILQKFVRVKIGKALLITDVLIVIAGGIIGGIPILICSFIGLLIKALGIDFAIGVITKNARKTNT